MRFLNSDELFTYTLFINTIEITDDTLMYVVDGKNVRRRKTN